MGERMECQTITAGGATSAGNTPMVSASAIKGASVSCNLAGCDGKCGICTPAPMPTERMEEVEVVVPCSVCRGIAATYCSGPCRATGRENVTAPVQPGSLTAARLRLADAAEAWAAKWLAPVACRDADEWDAMLESAVKLAALRTARGEG